MSATGLRLRAEAPAWACRLQLRRYAPELAWGAFALASTVAMVIWPEWQTIPFFFLWISLALIYGLRVWELRTTVLVLLVLTATSAAALTVDVATQHQDWKMLFKVPLMGMLFFAIVWYARGRVDALRASERHAAELHATLERQERFIHDASHELKTPVTWIAGCGDTWSCCAGRLLPGVVEISHFYR